MKPRLQRGRPFPPVVASTQAAPHLTAAGDRWYFRSCSTPKHFLGGTRMDEVIARVLRAVACFARLSILSRLLSSGEATPSQLARDLRLSRDLVSTHLARLTSAGLIQRRRSGARCFCRAGSPYSDRTLSGEIAGWLQEALSSSPGKSTGGPAAAHRDSPPPELHRAVFEAATAFTSPRRIQVMRRLAHESSVDGPTLIRELRMSEAALSRHLDKLIRRGYVSVVRAGRGFRYALVSAGKTPHHTRLLGIVQAHWGKQGLRS